MTRDVIDRLAFYARADIEVRRIALNMSQVQRYAPPPNFAKETDSRYAAYVQRFGTTDCCELDALPPTVIRSGATSTNAGTRAAGRDDGSFGDPHPR
jgi:hypothetical protein